jgi:hypothetical protein
LDLPVSAARRVGDAGLQAQPAVGQERELRRHALPSQTTDIAPFAALRLS